MDSSRPNLREGESGVIGVEEDFHGPEAVGPLEPLKFEGKENYRVGKVISANDGQRRIFLPAQTSKTHEVVERTAFSWRSPRSSTCRTKIGMVRHVIIREHDHGTFFIVTWSRDVVVHGRKQAL